MPKNLQRLLAPVLLLAFCVGAWRQGTALESVWVEVLPGAEEPEDGGLLGIGTGPPDYRLDVELEAGTVSVSAPEDTTIGEGLRFEFPDRPPLGALVGLRLVEDDAADDDLLEELAVELPVEGDRIDGEAYRFTLESGWSFFAGIEGFLETIPGVVLAVCLLMSVLMFAMKMALRGALEE